MSAPPSPREINLQILSAKLLFNAEFRILISQIKYILVHMMTTRTRIAIPLFRKICNKIMVGKSKSASIGSKTTAQHTATKQTYRSGLPTNFPAHSINTAGRGSNHSIHKRSLNKYPNSK
jgi:hypothetical protein